MGVVGCTPCNNGTTRTKIDFLPLHSLKEKLFLCFHRSSLRKQSHFSEKEACEFWADSAPTGPLLVQPLALTWMQVPACAL